MCRLFSNLFWKISDFVFWLVRKQKGLVRRIEIKRLHRRPGVQIGQNLSLGAHVTFALGQDAKLVIGDNAIISDYVWITVGDHATLEIGDNTYIFHHCAISSSTHSRIGNYCSLAPYVTIIDSNHQYDNTTTPIRFQGGTYSPITVADEVWIGTGVVVLEGVNLGKHCVVGANAVVTDDVPAFSVAVGVPARIVRRFGQDES